MKAFSLSLSLLTLVITTYFLATEFPELNSFDGVIYFFLMLLLLAICVIGTIVNRPEISRIHHKFRVSNYKPVSGKITKALQ